MQKILLVILSLLILFSNTSYADSFEKQASYTVCFTPGEDCTNEIIAVINNAISNIWVQAYSFTSKPIASALVLAKQRGVNVQVILDKEALTNKRTLRYLIKNKIPVWIDNQPAIAHNKVMIIDQTQIITGSFNYTYAAQEQNAENVLIVYDGGLAQKYLSNWKNRQRAAEFYQGPVYATATDDKPTTWLEKFWQWLVTMFNKIFFSSTR